MNQPTPTPTERSSKTTTVVVAVAFVLAALLMVMRPGKLYRIFTFEGEPATPFTLPNLHTQQDVSLDRFTGKVVVLDFWATWCPPCRKQMPILQKLENDPSLRDSLKILSINVDEPEPKRRAKVQRYLRSKQFTMTTLEDDGSAYATYMIASIPTLIIISPHGTISEYHQGVIKEDELRQKIAEAAKL